MLKTVVLLIAVVGSLQLSAAKNLPGAFKAPALAFYFVHKGGPLKLDFSATVVPKQAAKCVNRKTGYQKNKTLSSKKVKIVQIKE